MEALLAAVLVAIAVSYGLALARAIRRSGTMASSKARRWSAADAPGHAARARFVHWMLDAVVGAAAASPAVAAWIAARVEADVIEALARPHGGERGAPRVAGGADPRRVAGACRVVAPRSLGPCAVGIVSLLQGG